MNFPMSTLLINKKTGEIADGQADEFLVKFKVNGVIYNGTNSIYKEWAVMVEIENGTKLKHISSGEIGILSKGNTNRMSDLYTVIMENGNLSKHFLLRDLFLVWRPIFLNIEVGQIVYRVGTNEPAVVKEVEYLSNGKIGKVNLLAGRLVTWFECTSESDFRANWNLGPTPTRVFRELVKHKVTGEKGWLEKKPGGRIEEESVYITAKVIDPRTVYSMPYLRSFTVEHSGEEVIWYNQMFQYVGQTLKLKREGNLFILEAERIIKFAPCWLTDIKEETDWRNVKEGTKIVVKYPNGEARRYFAFYRPLEGSVYFYAGGKDKWSSRSITKCAPVAMCKLWEGEE